MASQPVAQDRIQTVNTYDQIVYANRPYAQTHPDHLAVLGLLHGMHPPPVDRARVLDVGASEGGNIIPMALTLPQAQFTGVDLAASPVERGNHVIRDLGLTNVRLMQMDLLEIDAAFGEFDYIIAHGLYAWTPAPVRDRILAIARAHLSPQGIAFVSYNAYPGGHLRRHLREAMLLHIGTEQDPAIRVERAREMLRLLGAGRPEPTVLHDAVAREAQEALKLPNSSVFHDYLAEVYEPSYLRDFVAHAARHGLAYLTDAAVMDTWNIRLAPETITVAERITGADRVLREQYFDLLRMRSFRQSLVCIGGGPIDGDWKPERAHGLYVSTRAEQTGPMQFTSAGGAVMTTPNLAVIEYLRTLAESWPRPQVIGSRDASLALELFRRGMVDLHTCPGAAVRAGERPVASPLARYQAQRRYPLITTLDHRALSPDDPAWLDFLSLLDGTRDRGAVAAESGLDKAQVEERLERLARLALLVA